MHVHVGVDHVNGSAEGERERQRDRETEIEYIRVKIYKRDNRSTDSNSATSINMLTNYKNDAYFRME